MRIKHFLPAVLTLVLFTAAQFAQAASLPEFSELAAKCGPAVVNISAERTSPAAAGPEEFFGEMFRGMPPGADRFFEFFGGPNARGKRPPQKQMSRGSGFIISPDGYIVTNYHVVADGDSIQVTLDESNGKTAPLTATVVGTDEDTDLALLKVEAKKDLPFLKFGDSDALLVGEWLLAIGNPFALDHTVTAGILSAKNRNIHAGPFDNFLQTDASINPGNSGGPLLNMKGEVIGINTAIIASGQGIGFAIPSNMAAGIVEQIKSGKKVSRGWIGVTIQDVDENTAKALGMEHPSGALVASVLDDEPAAKAGIEAGDVITKVNGKSVEDASALLRAIAAHKPGTSVTLDVWRNGKAVTMDVTLGDRQTGVNSGKPSEAGQKQQNQGQQADLGRLHRQDITDKQVVELGEGPPIQSGQENAQGHGGGGKHPDHRVAGHGGADRGGHRHGDGPGRRTDGRGLCPEEGGAAAGRYPAGHRPPGCAGRADGGGRAGSCCHDRRVFRLRPRARPRGGGRVHLRGGGAVRRKAVSRGGGLHLPVPRLL